jgi:hypothetical protein
VQGFACGRYSMTKRAQLIEEVSTQPGSVSPTNRRVRVIAQGDASLGSAPVADDYAAGYKRPPRKNRFKPGQSGNPHGRPKGEPNLDTAINKEMKSVISVQEGGHRPKKISKTTAVAKRLVNQAVSGNMKAITKLMDREQTGVAGAQKASQTGIATMFTGPAAAASKFEVLASLTSRLQTLQLAQEIRTIPANKVTESDKDGPEQIVKRVRRTLDPDDY